MKIFVCAKPVFSTDSVIKIDQNFNIVSQKDQIIINPFDEYAIEEALRVKERWSGSTVTAVSYGKAGQESVLTSALASGVDNAVFISSSKNSFSIDSYKTAMQLYHFISNENPDCIIMGKEAVDTQNGAVGSILASLMSIPITTNVHKCDFSKEFVDVERLISSGIQQKNRMKYPCIITVTKGINKPRYPSIKNILNAKNKPLSIIHEQDLTDSNEDSKVSFSYPSEAKRCKMIENNASNIADEIIKILNIN